MDAALNRKSLLLGVPGFVLQIAGQIMVGLTTNPDKELASGTELLGLVLILAGAVLLILGLGYYAKAKGHSRWWGLMGLLSIFGLIVLACLSDKHKQKLSP